MEGFVQGFEGAPLDRMSARSLYAAARTGEGEQRRPGAGGYGKFVRALAEAPPKERVQIRLGHAVTSVAWRRGQVRVTRRTDVLAHGRRSPSHSRSAY